MDYEEYKRLKEEIEAEYQKKKEALEMIWRMSQKHNGGNVSDGERSNISVSDSIRIVIDSLSGDFTADNIQQGLKDHNVKGANRLLITNTLHRLSRRNEIVVVKKGVGRTPSIYRKSQKVEGKT